MKLYDGVIKMWKECHFILAAVSMTARHRKLARPLNTVGTKPIIQNANYLPTPIARQTFFVGYGTY